MDRRLIPWCALFGAAVVPPAAAGAQAPTTVTGRVTGDAGQPLAGVQVYAPALGAGTVTRENGTYTLVIPARRATGPSVAVAVRLVGYRARTVQVALAAGAVTQDFALESAPTTLTAVVVTGAGTTSTRERLGTTINTVDTAAIRRAVQPQNLVSALTATAPNVTVRTSSGEPGASAFIQIRGASSVLGTNQPLFVVDGQPIDNSTTSTGAAVSSMGNAGTVTQNRASDVNPNDVESVEILKGAAASAIYGARAANGVVLITTKRGRAGQTRYALTSTNTLDDVSRTLPLQRTYGLGSNGVAPTCAGADCVPVVGVAAVTRSYGPALAAGTATYDHAGDIFKTGTTLDNNLQVSGGSDRTTFFLSGGLTAQDGVITGANNRYNRASVRLKASQQVGGALSLTGNFNFLDTRGRYIQKGSNTSGLLLGSLRTPPDFDNRTYLDPTSGLQRSYRFPSPTANSLTTSRGYDNPFFVANNPGANSQLGRFIGSVAADWTPLPWLRVQEQFGADQYADNRLEALPFTSSGDPIGNVTRFDQTSLQLDNNLIATASHAFSPAFTGRLTVGQNLNSQRLNSVFAFGEGLIAPQPFALQNTVSSSPPTEFRSLRHIEAYFGQAEADLYGQLFLTAGLRNDGFSTFGASSRRATYPKASAAWTFTTPLGLTDGPGVLSLGKLRASYGETGREPPVYSTVVALSTTTTYGSGSGDVINASQGGQAAITNSFQLGNPNLGPERNREFEVGTDLGLFGQRADLSFTYFDKRSSDLILPVPINAAANGGLNQFVNGASIRNKGLELQVNVRPYTSRVAAVEVGFNFGRTRGRVESLLGTDVFTYTSEGFSGAIGSSTVGYAPGVIRGNDFARCGRGLVVNGVDVDAGCGAGYKKGALYLAANGQPVSDPTDRVIADPNPKWTAGANASVRLYRRLRLSTLVDVRRGAQVWDGTRGALYSFGTHGDTEVRNTVGTFGQNFYTHLYPDVAGPGAGAPGMSTPQQWQAWFTSRGGSGGPQFQFVENGNFVKLRELSVAYTLDQPWVRTRIGVGSVDLRVAGRNLHTWTKYRGLDPESNLGGAEFLTQGIDYFNNPQVRSLVLAATISR